MFSLQKKIGKRNYCIIKSVIDYCLKSNMHTRRGLTIRLKKLKPRAPISGFPKFWEQGQFPQYLLATIFIFFVLVLWSDNFTAGFLVSFILTVFVPDIEGIKNKAVCF